jgi:hypothetical protein
LRLIGEATVVFDGVFVRFPQERKRLSAPYPCMEPHMKNVAIAFAVAVIGLPLASAGWVAAAIIAF